ncbi:Xylosyltransferase oxt [Trichinella murrelli]|uniref:protein xylosyltransferase n=1 Tax=Trichinella murrelli TaxID=144512 RepID=A0A0V0TJK9_9BILA|nr:Xylosyltransferase oxt [Trichinella murrelli]
MRIIPSFGWKRWSCHVAFGILITCLFYVNVFYLYHSAERDAEEFIANFKWLKRPLSVTARCNLSVETEKALKRAQSESCKQQIINAYCSHLKGSLYPAALHRSCPYEESFWRLRNLGCYADSRKKRLLNSAGIRIGNFNSINACVDYCFQLGCSIAGVEFGEECFCGKVANLKLGLKLEAGLCETYPCPANSSTACGGFNAIAVYHTGYKDPPKVKLKTSELLKVNTKPAKIAFLLQLNGRAVRQVVRLLRLIYRPEHIYLVHVDSRQNHMYREMISLQKSISATNFHVLTRRFPTIWGGASLLKMFLSSADELLQLSSDWEYLVNLSESDMPLRPVDELASLLGNCNGTSFLRSHGDTTVAFVRRQGLGKLFVECDNHMWRLAERQLPKGVRVDGGSDWLILHRSLVAYAAHEHDDQLVSGLRQFFQNALLPLETFFHTLAQNSPFCDRIVNSNLKLTNWHRKRGCNCQHLHVVDWCGCSPNVFRMADWDRLRKVTKGGSGLQFFARKFDPLIDLRIIVQLERTVANGNGDSANPASSFPYWQNEFHHVDDQLQSLNPRMRRFFDYAAHVGRHYLFQPTSCNAVQSVDCPLERVLQFNLFKQSNAELMDLLISIGGTCQSEQAAPLHGASFQWFAEIRLQRQRKITFGSGKLSKNRLLDIQLGNEYDVKEEMLRDYVAIVAKHDRPFLRQRWSMALSNGKENFSSITVVWSTPDGRIDEVQEQQFKANASDDVVVVHLQKQIGLSEDGIWSVRVQTNSDELLAEMSFPVIDPNERLMEKLARILDPFFSIKSACLIGKPNPTPVSSPHFFTVSQCARDLHQAYRVDCNSTDWSSHSAESISQLLLLLPAR